MPEHLPKPSPAQVPLLPPVPSLVPVRVPVLVTPRVLMEVPMVLDVEDNDLMVLRTVPTLASPVLTNPRVLLTVLDNVLRADVLVIRYREPLKTNNLQRPSKRWIRDA